MSKQDQERPESERRYGMSKKVMIGLIALVLVGGLAAAGYGLYRLGAEAGAQGGVRAARGAWRTDEEIVPRRAEGGSPGDGKGLGRGASGMGERGPGGQSAQRGGGGSPCEEPGWAEGERGGPGRSSGAGGQGQGGGTGQAEAPEWITLKGTVTEISAGQLTLKTQDGEEVTLMLGPEPYWSAQGITIEVGDEIEVRAYEEDGELMAGQITLTATGETLTLRDEMGRPLWMGGMGRGPGRGGIGVEQEEQGEASDES
jgi:hypothetical protein